MCTAVNFFIALILGVVAGSLIDNLSEPRQKCTTPNNEPGECVPLYTCAPLAKRLREKPIGYIEFVRKSRCGGNPYNTRVCCGTADNYTQWEELADRFNEEEYQTTPKTEATCITPHGLEGTCTPLYTCPPLLKAFANPLRGLKEDYKKYRCRDIDTYICCEHAWYAVQPLSNLTSCGLQQMDDYIPLTNRSGTTTIDEFPWLAAIVVPKLDRIVCQGVVINHRYILTAAQCFDSTEYKPEDITSVRLGGHHMKNTASCTKSSQSNAADCTSTKEFGVEERIVHEFYKARTGLNDIALIRLNRNISFTDFIQPICLPVPGTKFAKRRNTMYSAAWDKGSPEGGKAQVKKVLMTLIGNRECEERLKTTSVQITPLKMCTVESPLNKEFTCSGDIGGPVMSVYRDQWHIEGITSKNWPCGSGYPEVKTMVSQYLAWIRQNMRLHRFH